MAITTQVIGGRTFSQSHASAAFVDTSPGGVRSCDRRAQSTCLLYRCMTGLGTMFAIMPLYGLQLSSALQR